MEGATAVVEASQPLSPDPPEQCRQEKAEAEEYDSAGSYGEEEKRGGGGGSDSETSVALEREEGDGQESAPQKKVDDDEDKKNPQYIPKRGTFYEHDDRTAEEGEEVELVEPEKLDKDGKKKVWQDKKERWSHDRFNDSEQAPKSHSELVSIYGYDIRNEDGPPRARRRRRYGRGPNKYTRNWEDEDAYNKPPAPRVLNTKKPAASGRPKKSEEFPPLNPDDSLEEQDNSQAERTKSQESNGNIPSQVIERNPTAEPLPPSNLTQPKVFNSQQPYQQQQQQQNNQPRVGSGRVIKPKKEIKDSDYRGFTTKTRQARNLRGGEPPRGVPPMSSPPQQNSRPQRKDNFIQTQNFTNKNNNVQDLEKDMYNLHVQDGVYKGGKGQGQGRQGSVPPRLQNEQKSGGSKRYSSMRQRSLPEAATPPNFPATFYPNEYNQQNTPSQVGPLPPPPLTQPVPVTAAPLLQPQFPPPPFPQAPPPFIQQGPPFIPPQTPQLINYVQPGQAPFPPNYQGYQQPFNPVSPPTELYQPQGGITYYSTDQQQIAQRSLPEKRRKAAIPIVAPPDNELKPRGSDLQDNSPEPEPPQSTIEVHE